jgi:hypothetical protein
VQPLSQQHLQRISESNGIAIADLDTAQRLNVATFTAAMARLGAVLQVDYLTQEGGLDTQNSAKARILWETLREEKWTELDFTRRFAVFLREVKFANWTIADFLARATPAKLYSAAWSVKEHRKDNTAYIRMEAYVIQGVVLWRYIPEHETALEGLERVFFRGVWSLDFLDSQNKAAEREAVGNQAEESDETVDFAVRYAQSEKRVRELEEKVKKLHYIIEIIEKERNGLADYLTILEAKISTILETQNQVQQ